MDTPLTLTRTRIQSGVWEGLLTSADPNRPPKVAVTHLGQPLKSFSLTETGAAAGSWSLRIAIPPDLLSDGVQTFLIADAETGATLGSFAVVTGEPLEDDIRAEVDLLRAELDLLKRAFRRHCLETL